MMVKYYKCENCGTGTSWNHKDNCPADYMPYNFEASKAFVKENTLALSEAAKVYTKLIKEPTDA